jgi:hypothetical protein
MIRNAVGCVQPQAISFRASCRSAADLASAAESDSVNPRLRNWSRRHRRTRRRSSRARGDAAIAVAPSACMPQSCEEAAASHTDDLVATRTGYEDDAKASAPRRRYFRRLNLLNRSLARWAAWCLGHATSVGTGQIADGSGPRLSPLQIRKKAGPADESVRQKLLASRAIARRCVMRAWGRILRAEPVNPLYLFWVRSRPSPETHKTPVRAIATTTRAVAHAGARPRRP